jgi:hypothetical protein
MTNHTIRFAETQYFRQLWLWLTMGGTAVLTMGLFAWGLYVQLVQGEPWGDKPMSDTALIVTAILVFAFDLALLALFVWGHLRTEVRDDGLYVRLVPIHLSFHRLPLVDVRQVEAVTYRAIMDYGGWGIRYSFSKKGKAYNVSGNRGVRLTYTTGRHLLLGSQQPDQLATAIEALRESGRGR